MKLPSLEGAVITTKSNQKATKKCYENSLKTKRGVCSITNQPQRGEGVARTEMARERRLEPIGEVLEREIGGKKFTLGKSLGQETQGQIFKVITQHLDADLGEGGATIDKMNGRYLDSYRQEGIGGIPISSA